MVANKLIVITGLDGAGKNFVAKHLHALDSHSSLIVTPTTFFLPCRNLIDSIALTVPSAHYYFYLASVIHASAQIEEMLKKGNVYCVRYLIDTVVYHKALGLPVELEYETKTYKIRRPDLTVFLSVEESVRQERLKSRYKTTLANQIASAERFREAILREYLRLRDYFVIVDNSRRSINDVIAEIREHISKLEGK
jgi:thymidylate kinase